MVLRSRKWQITQNNPNNFGLTFDIVQMKMNKIQAIEYYCYSLEKGLENETEHFHLYFVTKNGIRFDTIKKIFPKSHIEPAKGTSLENRNYIFKEGKYADTAKCVGNIRESHFELCECPVERQGVRNDLVDLIDLIKSGASLKEILDEYPSQSFSLDKIDKLRLLYDTERLKTLKRDVEVVYIFGRTRTGKTYKIWEDYSQDIFCVDNLESPFDGYSGEKVLLLDEYRNDFTMKKILRILDNYPYKIHRRYNDCYAEWTKVFITSNWSPDQQYLDIQSQRPDDFMAFVSRLTKIRQYINYNQYVDYNCYDDYIKNRDKKL